jgi:RimJ/RimL family protein N-acetyltransferase
MIKGKKVGLRAIEKTDLELLKQWRNIPEFRENFREVRELNLFNQELWFEKTNKSMNDFMFMIVRLEDGELLGAGGLLYINWIIRSADYSFYIGYQEKYIDNDGYAEEAAQLLLNYGFNNLNLNKIWMELYEFDSLKLTFFKEKFKFCQDGCLRDNCFEKGRYWDSYIISLTRKDFDRQKNEI